MIRKNLFYGLLIVCTLVVLAIPGVWPTGSNIQAQPACSSFKLVSCTGGGATCNCGGGYTLVSQVDSTAAQYGAYHVGLCVSN